MQCSYKQHQDTCHHKTVTTSFSTPSTSSMENLRLFPPLVSRKGLFAFFLTRLFWHSTWSVKPSISPGAQASYNTTLIRRLRWKLGFLQNKIKVKANCKTCTINFGFKNCVTSPNRTGQTRKENLVARYFERTIPVFICFIWRNSRI